MRVLGATDNDLRVTADYADFNLYRRTRLPGSAPTWCCRLEQEVKLTNLSLNEVGAPAATLAAFLTDTSGHRLCLGP